MVVEPLEEIPARSVHQQNVRLGALRIEILCFAVRRDAKVDQCVVQPNLVSQRNERALLVQVQRGGLRVQRIEPEILILRAVVEKTAVQNMLRTEVVLQAEEVVAGPLGGSIRAGGQLFNQ